MIPKGQQVTRANIAKIPFLRCVINESKIKSFLPSVDTFASTRCLHLPSSAALSSTTSQRKSGNQDNHTSIRWWSRSQLASAHSQGYRCRLVNISHAPHDFALRRRRSRIRSRALGGRRFGEKSRTWIHAFSCGAKAVFGQ